MGAREPAFEASSYDLSATTFFMASTSVAVRPARRSKRASAGAGSNLIPATRRDIAQLASECRRLVTRRALISAGASIVPLPGVDVAVDITVLLKMIEQINQRFKYLLAQGQTGLSTAFDFPTLMGYDSDSPRALGEVGMCGVAVDTLRDMEVLFDGIPLDKVTTSMTINGPAIVLLCFYIALADKRGIPRSKIGGTVQNDCLKEFIAQHAWLVPPRPAMRVVTDMIEFCSREVPRWNSVSISG